MPFISVTIKRSRLNGGNLCYSLLSSNILRKGKQHATKTAQHERVTEALRTMLVPV